MPRLYAHHTAVHLWRRPEVVAADLHQTGDALNPSMKDSKVRSCDSEQDPSIHDDSMLLGTHLQQMRNTSQELGVDSEAAKQAVAGACNQSHGKLVLKHDHRSPEGWPMRQQLECEGRRDLVWNVGNTDIKVRKVLLHYIPLDDLYHKHPTPPLVSCSEHPQDQWTHTLRDDTIWAASPAGVMQIVCPALGVGVPAPAEYRVQRSPSAELAVLSSKGREAVGRTILWSTSTAMTFFALSRSFKVRLPVPGPISSTTSVLFTPALSTMD